MIRPRTGDFLYTQAEFEVMVEDIKIFKEAGVDGIVCGVLRADGTVDLPRTERSVFAFQLLIIAAETF